jgi:hypothetical protein
MSKEITVSYPAPDRERGGNCSTGGTGEHDGGRQGRGTLQRDQAA